jgi:UDP-N-acetylmuramoylalanine--D-glutamate ligase
MEEYRTAKLRIFASQTADDFAVVNARESLPALAARRITFSAHTDAADFTLRGGVISYQGQPVLDQSTIRLQGIHNAENLMAAFGTGLALGVDLDRMAAAVADYTAPAHRCEFVRDFEGVHWINDSKATNLDSVEKALLSQQRPVILLAGGKDKGFGFDPIAPLVRERVRAAVLIGEMKDRIARSWPDTDCRIAASLEEAVHIARDLAAPGDAVLFSPGTSSYDMFRNYGERGNRFKDLVNNLTPKNPH